MTEKPHPRKKYKEGHPLYLTPEQIAEIETAKAQYIAMLDRMLQAGELTEEKAEAILQRKMLFPRDENETIEDMFYDTTRKYKEATVKHKHFNKQITITPRNRKNPRQVCTHGQVSWEIIKNAGGTINYNEYMRLGGRGNDLRYDIKHEYVSIEDLSKTTIQKETDASLPADLIETSKSKNKDFDEHYKLRLSELENTDVKGNQATSRKEQGTLRTIVFMGLQEEKCAICHKTLPTDLMVAAHIKPRSKCSTPERKNLNVVMPVCKIGCDDFFEKGYLIVDGSGKICLNHKKHYSAELKAVLSTYKGKHCTHFNEETMKFFEFKRDDFD